MDCAYPFPGQPMHERPILESTYNSDKFTGPSIRLS